jgi:hypothetical protein
MLYKNYEITVQSNWLRTPSYPHSWLAQIYGDNTDPEWYNVNIRVGGSSPKEVFESAKLEIELREIEYLKGRMKRSVHKILKLDKNKLSMCIY